MNASSTLIIKDHMREVMVSFTPETAVLRAVDQLLEQEVSGAPVLDQLGNIVGFLSERDVMAVALDSGYYDDPAGKVGTLMSTTIHTVDAEDSIVAAARIFRDTPVKTLPVLKDSRLVGMITRRDVLRAFVRQR
ncbi:CBS domain-containing protein [Salinisphaera sp. T31B1]|uniref:CBS domain-containing protein n=1 Tax=Salinisphaera sp. T31B1 TaxID=727963 RepID=UPI00334217DE